MRCGDDFVRALEVMKSIGMDCVSIRDNKISQKDKVTGVNVFFELNEDNSFEDIILPIDQLYKILSKKKYKDQVEMYINNEDPRFDLFMIKRGKIKSSVFPLDTNSITQNRAEVNMEFLTSNSLEITKEEIIEIKSEYNSDEFDIYLDANLGLQNIRMLSRDDENEYCEFCEGSTEGMDPIRFKTDIFSSIKKTKNFELYINKIDNPNGDDIYVLCVLTYVEGQVFLIISQNCERSL